MAALTEEKAIARAAESLLRRDPERTFEQHEQTVRDVIDAIREHLVLRCLYDSVVSQLRDPDKPRGMET